MTLRDSASGLGAASGGAAASDASPPPEPPAPVDRYAYVSEEAHQRALLLSEVAADGVAGFARVLRRAASGDPVAARLTVSSMLRAVPPLTALQVHEFLSLARVRESDLASEITPDQRVTLMALIQRSPHM
ncbi:hypothetical protein [Actinacidiphila yeochonensis]|uniref:hypothetical protein n=1 Tax=Actinacidiphila yeochonensis TaxID=89050 RepID=UPI0005611E55|nr:hypothetical protein [Actinacidiphila yeochonensis]